MSERFSDQYAFRPTCSTTSALVAILDDVTRMLQSDQYVHIIALDFSKAFDTVKHKTLFEKLAPLPLPDYLYNWVASFFRDRTHKTKCSNAISGPRTINAGVIQGSAIGPAAFVINQTDLVNVCPQNKLHKYADDTYLY